MPEHCAVSYTLHFLLRFLHDDGCLCGMPSTQRSAVARRFLLTLPVVWLDRKVCDPRAPRLKLHAATPRRPRAHTRSSSQYMQGMGGVPPLADAGLYFRWNGVLVAPLGCDSGPQRAPTHITAVGTATAGMMRPDFCLRAFDVSARQRDFRLRVSG